MLASYLLLLSSLVAVHAQSACSTAFGNQSAPCVATAQGSSFTWQGLQAFSSIPGNFGDNTNNTFGGVGSAIAMQPRSFKQNSDGTYSGVLIVQPDRGHNSGGAATVDYHGRQHLVAFSLKPYTGNGTAPSDTLVLEYQGTTIYEDSVTNDPMTGANPTALRPASGLDPIEPTALSNATCTDNNDPSTCTTDQAIVLDAEGLAILSDGSFYASDEYGPYVHYFNAQGVRQSSYAPPDAFVPHNSTGLYFDTTGADPTSGRVPNQGFEGLTVSPDNKQLFALVQNGGSSSSKGRYTRLLVLDISTPTKPSATAEYVVQLPLTSDGKIAAQSEVHYVRDNLLFMLPRDGKGNGNGVSVKDTTSLGKNIGFVDISSATNILGQFDGVGGTWSKDSSGAPTGLTYATFTPFIELTNSVQLAKFGLTNGAGNPVDYSKLPTDIVGKFESIFIVPAIGSGVADDYFVFSVADNDFITVGGRQSPPNTQYNDAYAVQTGQNVPTQFFVHRAILPGAVYQKYALAPTSTTPSKRRARQLRARQQATFARPAIDALNCPAPESFCSGECVNVQYELSHCGSCGNDCTQRFGRRATCVEGRCVR